MLQLLPAALGDAGGEVDEEVRGALVVDQGCETKDVDDVAM